MSLLIDREQQTVFEIWISFYFPRLSLERTILLKQQLSKMGNWLSKAEKKMEKERAIGSNYDDVKKQLDEHQVTDKVFNWHTL